MSDETIATQATVSTETVIDANTSLDTASDADQMDELTPEMIAELEREEAELPCEADIGLEEEELDMEESGDRGLFTQIPASGVGFYTYTPRHKQFGRPETLGAIAAVCSAWAKAHPNGPRIAVGNISLENGGPMAPHKSHKNGLDVDFRPCAKNGKEIPMKWNIAGYSRELTTELVRLIQNNGVTGVKVILFNDPKIQGVKYCGGHDNHLHVSFLPSGKAHPAPFSTDKRQTLRLVEPYMRGENVRKMQEALIKAGYAITADGIFGPGTQAAVKQYQQANGLTVDGIAGKNTLAKLGL